MPGGEERVRHRDWSARSGPLETAALDLVRQQETEGGLEALLVAFAAELDRYAGDCRLQDVHYVLTHPLKAGEIAADLAAEFALPVSLETCLAAAARHLDLSLEPSSTVDSADLQGLLDPEQPFLNQHLFLPFFSAGLQAATAFAPLDADERRKLLSGVPPLLERFGRTFYLDEGDSAETAAHLRTLRLAKKVDLADLFAGARTVIRLGEPETLGEIRRLARQLRRPDATLPPSFGGDFLYARRTPAGWVLIGDTGPNYYGEDAALIVDLGGDDTYFNNCAAPLFAISRGGRRRLSPAGLIIDYQGNDRYIGSDAGAVGGAVGGIGLLLDLEGDDLYQGKDLTQGAAFCGVGVLWDRDGNDVYLAREGVQGAAFCGAGLLLDESGADLYAAAQFAQGFGGSRGLGLLLDRQGDDRFLADRQVPSLYGTPGAYSGWAQGAGCGFRGFSSGGIGLLLDGAGDDEYQAGDFSQGTGVFFGMGILVDGDGDDAYLGTRYAQGAGAHQAVGVLLDLAGNDRYFTQKAASQGVAWDAAVGILEDRRGNDRYRGGELAQGAAAMNGLGLLYDRQGKDNYQARSGQGLGGSTDFWGGRKAPNLGLLIDVGGAPDTYSSAGRKNRTTSRTPGIGLFLDR